MKRKYVTTMKKSTLILLIVVWCLPIYAQKQSLWKSVGKSTTTNTNKKTGATIGKEGLLFELDTDVLKDALIGSQNKTAKTSSVEITIPNLNGVLEKFLVWESSNFEPELQAKYPDIKAYAGIGITDPKASVNFSLSPKGMQTMVMRSGNESEFIEASPSDKKNYVLFSAKGRANGSLPFACKTEDVVINNQILSKVGKVAASNKLFKTLKLALSCTGEYAAYHGGTKEAALAAMNATMTRVNGVFNRDLAVQLIIIGNNTNVIYTDATTDPYSDAGSADLDVENCMSTTGDCPGRWNNELQTTLTSQIGEGNYDIGHLFGATGGGGNAGCIGCVCDALTSTDSTPVYQTGKGSGYTSPADGIPQGDSFDIDFVAHEMGHQLGANHTFSHDVEGTGVNVEPGSGSTIMGYAGITTDYDVQSKSDAYFAYASILQIQNKLATKSCPVSSTISSNRPVIDAGVDFTIPKGTAFILKGTGSDLDGDTITYTWEQNDSANNSASGSNSFAVSTKTSGPLFRSLSPSLSAIRYMPNYSNVLANKLTSNWESVSTVARTLHFVLTGRDNAAQGAAQTNSSKMTVNVSGTAGPFAVTSQNTENTSWLQGSSQTITWSVNGTDGISGSDKVNIKLSVDGGLTFTTVLASNTANDGSEVITVPNVSGKKCRILIEPVANIYYAVNSAAFSVGYSVSSSCATYSFSGAIPFAIPDGTTSYTTRTFTFPSSTATVSNVSVGVGFNHSWTSDVQIELVNPQGTVVKLFDRNCGSDSTDLLLKYDDSGTALTCATTTVQTVAPVEALGVFKDLNPQGTWTLRVRDVDTGKTGTFKSASLSICTQTFTLVTTDFNISDFVLYPNPNKGDFNIQFTSQSESGVKVLVHDLLGRKLFDRDFEKGVNFNKNIQLQQLQSGVYLLTVIDGSRKKVEKLVIE